MPVFNVTLYTTGSAQILVNAPDAETAAEIATQNASAQDFDLERYTVADVTEETEA